MLLTLFLYFSRS